FLYSARSNKPLRFVHLQTDGFNIVFGRGTNGTMTMPAAVGEVARQFKFTSPAPLLSADGRTLSIPCVLCVAPAPERLTAEEKVQIPLQLEPDPVLRVTLHDEDDIVSGEPVRLAINSRPDPPPQVETRLKGIGNSITRQATIPVVGESRDQQDPSKVYGVTDDYGIADARFEYKLEAVKTDATDTSYQAVPFMHAPEGRKQFPLDEKFKVLPLDLAVGQRFTL